MNRFNAAAFSRLAKVYFLPCVMVFALAAFKVPHLPRPGAEVEELGSRQVM
jgi:hypothetical protein